MKAVAICVAALLSIPAHAENADLSAALAAVALNGSVTWGTAVSIAAYGGSPQRSGSAADGYVSYPRTNNTRKATTQDLFGFGSATKTYTACAVLRLVEQGTVGINDTIPQHIDPVLKNESGRRLVDYFGEAVNTITIWQLLRMEGGLDDWDTDETRAWQNAHPTVDMTPSMLLNKTAYNASRPVGPRFYCAPGSCGWYSSTSYVLLGYILALYEGGGEWKGYDQRSLPGAASAQAGSPYFPLSGTYESITAAGVHGYEPSGQDVFQHSALAGWTSGNLYATPMDVAQFSYALFGTRDVVGNSSLDLMLDFHQLVPWAPDVDGIWYGMGTMILGVGPPYGSVTGHAGAVYGFYGIHAYSDQLNISLSVAVARETEVLQTNLWDVYGQAWEAVLQWHRKRPQA